MKIIAYLIVMLYVCISCTDSNTELMDKVLNGVEKPVNSDQTNIINELKPALLDIAKSRPAMTRSNEKAVYLSEEEFNEIKFSSLPYFELDEEAFYIDPSPENLINCIKPAKDRHFFLGKKNGNMAVTIEAIMRDSKWSTGLYLEGFDYFKNNFSWVAERLANCDEKSLYLLTFLEHVYVVCALEKEPYFFNFIGTDCMDKKSFAKAMLNLKNIKDDTKKYFEKLGDEKINRKEQGNHEKK